MKVVILAGGLGTRLSEETNLKPKSLVEIGNKPILWHIMKMYSAYGINEFVICCGYKGDIIKEYFLNSFKLENIKLNQDFSEMTVIQELTKPWNVVLVDTGENTMTGGRLKRVEKFIGKNTFCFTYGDTLNNVNIQDLISFHKKKNLLATVTACRPPEKYGVLILKNDEVVKFKEKPVRDDWVNGGFFVLEPKILEYISDDSIVWENEPMEKIVDENQLAAYKHTGFYQSMDTSSDKKKLESVWQSEKVPWKVW